MRFGLILVIVASVFSFSARAQDTQPPASLVADSVTVDPAGRITASGNVEVFQDGTRLTASRVIYDQRNDELIVEGPITVTEPGGAVFAADEASLSPGLEAGLLNSARLVLEQQLQLSANSIARVNARYSTFDRVVASSCQVCDETATPLWEIRARRVIQDSVEGQLYFEGAQFRVAGVPLAYLPRLRLPDPSIDRAQGVLTPRISTTSSLGTGIKVPYFIPIGPHADATLTPYFSSSTRTLEFEFRQELRLGRVDIEGAVTDDDIEGSRGYLFGDARLQLPRDFVARLQLQLVSDPGYLFLYGYSDLDRLSNVLSITRVRDKDFFRASLSEYRTLREDEIARRDTLPDRYIDLTYRRDLLIDILGGQMSARVDTAALNRPSSEDILGRDTSRFGGEIDWVRDGVIGPGIVARGEAGLRIDFFNTAQDTRFTENVTRTIPRGAIELRWPFARQSGTVSEVIEPIARLDVSNVGGERVPLEDSRVVEFDEANLFAPTRYPGLDGAEDGVRVALGASWRRQATQGWMTDLTVGRVANLDGDLGFSDGTGLEGDQSEWLLAGRFVLGSQFWLTTRSLFDDDFTFTLSETRLDWLFDRGRITSSYIQAEPEPAEGRTTALSEWAFEGDVALNSRWRASGEVRYDFNAGQAARAGIGLDYRNECVAIDFSLSRRIATSSNVSPTTDFGFRVSLLGVGNGQEASAARRACRG